jgi:hypothetical protein
LVADHVLRLTGDALDGQRRVGVGVGARSAGGTTGVLTSGFSPGRGVGDAAGVGAGLAAVFVSEPPKFITMTTTTATTIPTARTPMPSASALRRQ